MNTDKETTVYFAVINRGLHWYKKLDPKNAFAMLNAFEVSELNYFLRCLAEVTRGMELWLDNPQNTNDFAQAAIDDVMTIMHSTKRIFENFDHEIDLDLIDKANKIKTFKYGEEQIAISDFRKQKYEFAHTLMMTSKFCHQDEATIAMHVSNDEESKKAIHNIFATLFSAIAWWRCEFRSQIFAIQNKRPEMIKYFFDQGLTFPFPHDLPDPGKELEFKIDIEDM